MKAILHRSRLELVSAFENEARACQTLNELSEQIEIVVSSFGFRWFTLLQDIDLIASYGHGLLLTNFPSNLTEEYISLELYRDDPFHAACMKTVSGVCWDEVENLIDLTHAQRAMLQKVSSQGLLSGYTMPLRMTGEPDVMFSVVRETHGEISFEDQLITRLVGLIALEQARRLFKIVEPVKTALSPRQIECISLVAQGKSDWEIGQILGLSKDTVHEYIEGARKRYGVRRRTQMVLRAVRDGHLDIRCLV